jgi:hypothetical protein
VAAIELHAHELSAGEAWIADATPKRAAAGNRVRSTSGRHRGANLVPGASRRCTGRRGRASHRSRLHRQSAAAGHGPVSRRRGGRRRDAADARDAARADPRQARVSGVRRTGVPRPLRVDGARTGGAAGAVEHAARAA